MAKPLVSNDPNPKDVSFSHFGVLDDGKRSKGAAITSIIVNGLILLILITIGMIVKTNPAMARKLEAVYLPPKQPEPKPVPKPPPPPPKPLPPVPKIELEPPKIKLPEPTLEKVPDIKPMIVPVPKPIVLNAPAPKAVTPPPAPRAVNLARPSAASIANNDAHPSAVRLGNPEIRALNGAPAVTPVNLGGGMHNMSASNTGSGPRAAAVHLGSGSPGSSNIYGKDRGAVVVKGLGTGVPGGTGTGRNGPQQVHLQEAAQPPSLARPVVHIATLAKPPVVTYQPKAEYTPEATALHLQGEAVVRIVLRANGTVEVVGIVHGLGHGLDESALRVAQGIRFRPALNSDGQPTDFPTTIVVRFVSNS